MKTPAAPKILAVTLARGGSKGIPKKNIRPLNGVPLLAYTIAEAKRSKHISRYIVSTDDPEIQSVAIDYGAEAPFLRPARLAADKVSSLKPLQHATAWAENDEGLVYDYVIELMATNPMKTHSDIDAVLEKLISTGADSVIGVVNVEDAHPARIKKIVDDRIVDFCIPEPQIPRQDLHPKAYLRNGSIYAMRRDVLMIDNIRYGSAASRPYIMPYERSINIDTLVDFLTAESLVKLYPKPYIMKV